MESYFRKVCRDSGTDSEANTRYLYPHFLSIYHLVTTTLLNNYRGKKLSAIVKAEALREC